MKVLNRIKDVFGFFLGRDIPGPDLPPPVDPNGHLHDPRPPTSVPPDHALFKRLYAESQSTAHSYVRRVQTDILKNRMRLIDELIMLMFNLQRPTGTFVQSSLIEALDRYRLSTFWSVLYIYVDEDIDVPTTHQLQVSFYDRIMELSKKSRNLQSFINERYQLHQRQPGNQVSEEFNPHDNERATVYRGLIVNLFGCQFSISRKDFPEGSTDNIFIVGRMPLYDKLQMIRVGQPPREPENNQESQGVYLAVTVKADGHHEGKPIRFNAHRFGSYSDNSPQREFSLYIGNWRTDWEFSFGAAEHDEIQHTAMLERAARLRLNNLQISINHWDYRPQIPQLPKWIKFFNHDETRKPRQEGIRLCFVKPPALFHPLVNVIGRQQFRQEISLIGRMLPSAGGQLHRFLDVTDSGLRSSVRNLNVTSAIEVRDSLWLIKTEDNKVIRVSQPDQRRWETATLDHGATFTVGNTEYKWHAKRANLYPDGFAGALSIYPSTEEVRSYRQQLNVDKDAEGFLVSFDGPFERKINPDDLLGRNGVVTIKCVDVSEDGRGKYAFMPVRDPVPVNSFFAFQPVYAREKGWPSGKAWLTYNAKSPSELSLDAESGEVGFEGKRVLAEDHSYHLICGSSLFQLKVSGTPYIGSPAVVSAPVPAATSDAPPAATAASSEFSPIDIQIRLSKTPWGGYGVRDTDRSNFAAHFSLTAPDDTEPRYFLKAFFPHSMESSNRELKFYERYRSRAHELFLSTPEVLKTTTESNEEAPWGLVFPLLHTYEKYLPSAGQATIWQAAAVGIGMATLFKAMAEDGLINFDIDVTQFCFESSGRLVIVDFDNVFQILRDAEDEAQLEPLLSILRQGRLPAKNSVLPPEAHAFIETANPDDRARQLAQIGPAFNTYMLAVVVLQLLKMKIPFEAGALVRHAAAENLDPADVTRFEKLLQEMLKPAAKDRPGPSEALSRLQTITRVLCEKHESARADCVKLLGRELL